MLVEAKERLEKHFQVDDFQVDARREESAR